MNVLEGERDVGIHRNSYDCRCVHAICTISTEDGRESNAVCHDGGHGVGFPTSRAGELIFYRSTEYSGIGDGILLYIACPPGIPLSHSPDSPFADPASGVRTIDTGETCGLTERLTGFQGGRILKNKKTRTLWSGVKEVMRFVGLFICGHVVYCGVASGLPVW